MTPEAQRIAIADFCGWTDVNFYEDNAGPGFWNGYPPVKLVMDKNGEWDISKACHHTTLPDYLNDLNACAKLCERLAELGWRCELNNGLDNTWECIFFRKRSESTKPENQGERREFDPPFSEEHYCPANTMAEAICGAALRTIGKWKEDE